MQVVQNRDTPRVCLPIKMMGREFEPLHRSLHQAGAALTSVFTDTLESTASISNTHSPQMPETWHQTPHTSPCHRTGFTKAGGKMLVWSRGTPQTKLPPMGYVAPLALPICPRTRRALCAGPVLRGAMGATLGTCGSHNGLWVLGG